MIVVHGWRGRTGSRGCDHSKSKKASIKIIGVQARSVPPQKRQSVRDPRAGFRRERPSRTVFGWQRRGHDLPLIQQFVDQLVLASEEEIADAMLLLLERKHIVAEGAGAVPLAAIMNGSIEFKQGSNIVLVISGGNVESNQLFRVIRQSLTRQGRIIHFSVMLDDQPGTSARFLSVIAKERGNILHIHHTQGDCDIPVLMAKVTIELETRGSGSLCSQLKSILDKAYESGWIEHDEKLESFF